MRSRRAVVRAAVLAVLLLPLAWHTLSISIPTMRMALRLAGTPPIDRRAIVLGSWARYTAPLAQRLPRETSIDIILVDPRAVDVTTAGLLGVRGGQSR